MVKKDKTTKDNKPFLVLSSKAVLGLSGFFLFSFIFIFVIGTLVGRGRISLDLEKDKLALEISGISETAKGSDAKNPGIGPNKKSKFDFYEALESSEKTKPVKKRKTVKHKVKKVKKKKHIAIKQPSKSARTQKKENTAKHTKATKPDIKEPSLYKYTVQAASFKTPEDAGKMVDNLKKRGYQAYTVKALVRNNELWYRVWIGSFRDRIDAKETIGRLKKDNIETFLVNRQEKQ